MATTSYVQRVRNLQYWKEDDPALDSQLQTARCLLFGPRGHVLLSNCSEATLKIVWVKYDELPPAQENTIVLDIDDQKQLQLGYQFHDLSEEKKQQLESQYSGKFLTVRTALALLPKDDLYTVFKANALLSWHRENKFCSACGSGLYRNPSGYKSTCISCEKIHYATSVNPVAITLVKNQTDSKVLLVRQPRYPPSMYSCVAGFIEAGETLEEAAKREVAEEVGLELVSVSYSESQPWSMPPGPSNLMLGCNAVVADEKITLDNKELEDGRWFTVEEVAAAVANVLGTESGGPSIPYFVPPPGAVAHSLIHNWLKEKMSHKL